MLGVNEFFCVDCGANIIHPKTRPYCGFFDCSCVKNVSFCRCCFVRRAGILGNDAQSLNIADIIDFCSIVSVADEKSIEASETVFSCKARQYLQAVEFFNDANCYKFGTTKRLIVLCCGQCLSNPSVLSLMKKTHLQTSMEGSPFSSLESLMSGNELRDTRAIAMSCNARKSGPLLIGNKVMLD